ncbi:MAG: ElyC/SanA/YdcF family protein [Candidatus Paceibacterota bacterium]|jgi:SanA protein
MKKTKIKILRAVAVMFVFAAIAIISINYIEIKSSERSVYRDIGGIETNRTAIVFGAKVRGENMSSMFEDRVVSALELYRARKIEKILVSGDHGRPEYDEVNAAKDYLVSNGADADDIFTDYAGFDTYDTLYRAKEIFGVEGAILVTQEFHLYRALFIAKSINMNVVGYASDRHDYPGKEIYSGRELFARVKAYFDVILKSKPKFLGDKIPIEGDGRESWDN